MMMSCFGRYNNASSFFAALLSALFLVVFQQSSSSSFTFVAATARRPAASLKTHAIATDGGPRDFTAPARKAWVAETTKKSTGSQSSSEEEVAQLGAGGNYFVHSSVRFLGVLVLLLLLLCRRKVSFKCAFVFDTL